MQKILLLLMVALLGIKGQHLLAQSATDTFRILLASRAYEDQIVLRWVPDGYEAWQGGLRGYKVERYTLATPAGTLDATALRQSRILLEESVQPLAEAEWKPLADTNQMAIVAAGALYSDTFETSDMGDDSAVLYSENSTAENRYGFGLFAADQFLDIAKAMGLAYVDQQVEPGFEYLYKVSFQSDPPDKIILPGQSKIVANERTHLVPPVDLTAEWRNRKVLLSWNRQLVDTLYTSYFVEKSIDQGQTFSPANKLPLVYFPPEGTSAPYMYYLDSLVDNETAHFYRVRGKTPFGEMGPPSQVISGKGLPPPFPFLPRITRMDELPEAAGFQITWAIEDTLLEQVVGFHLYRSVEKDAVPIRLNASLLSSEARQFVDPDPKHAYYYRVSLMDNNGYEVFSLNKLALLTDHTPPRPPLGLQTEMDTTGLATLHWQKNTEEDLQGYRVYTSNIKDGDYFELTYLPISATRFQHQFSINTLHEVEYFKVRAIDLRGNYSDFSAAAKVMRPDLKPPTPPAMKEIRADTKAIYLSWANSSSADVIQHLLMRTVESANSWEQIAEFVDDTHAFSDSSGQKGQSYAYQVIAIDDAGLQSVSQILRSTRIDDGSRGHIQNWGGSYQPTSSFIRIHWTYEESASVLHYLLYRAEGNAPITVYKKLNPGSELSWQNGQLHYHDSKVQAGRQYHYRLIAIHPNSAHSKLTDELVIETP